MKISSKFLLNLITTKLSSYSKKLYRSLDKIGKKINRKFLLILSKRIEKAFSYYLHKEMQASNKDKNINKISKRDSNLTLYKKI